MEGTDQPCDRSSFVVQNSKAGEALPGSLRFCLQRRKNDRRTIYQFSLKWNFEALSLLSGSRAKRFWQEGQRS
jgi:hypothetical protein